MKFIKTFALAASSTLALCVACQSNSEGPQSGADAAGAAGTMTTPDVAEGPFPGGKKIAISLTYDDALSSQRMTAADALRQFGFKATFFLSGVGMDNPRWADVRAEGHELGSHTIEHPCDGSQSWVRPGYGYQDYDLERMADELDASLEVLKSHGEVAPFTFAYPCGNTVVGEGADEESYIPLIEERFLAARGVIGQKNDFANVDLYDVDAYTAQEGETAARLLSYLNNAEGTWVVFLFHGVGDQILKISAEEHQKFLEGLAARDDVYIAPFRDVALLKQN